jgi:hypothetical protein
MRLNTDRFDLVLDAALKAAKRAADNYCNNPFLNDDNTPRAIPEDVEVWLLQFATRKVNVPEGNMSQESMQGVGVFRRDYDYNLMLGDLKPYRFVPRLGSRKF